MAFPKTFLHWMQLAVSCQTFDCGHFAPIRLNGQNRAGLHGVTIEQYRAGAANAGFTTNVGPGEFAVFAQEVNQEHPWLDFVFSLDSIDFDRNQTFHMASENAVSVLYWSNEGEY